MPQLFLKKVEVKRIDHKPHDGNLAELLCALSFATGIGFGGHIDHGLKSASLGLQIADALSLSDQERAAVFYGALLKDVACTACSAGLAAFLPDEQEISLADVILIDPSRMSDMLGWLSHYVTLDARFPARIAKLLSFIVQCGTVTKEFMRGHCEIAELFARQLDMPEHVQQTVRFQWERWDGRGMAYGLKGTTIPITARILHLAQVLELTHHFGDATKTITIAQEKRGTRFDPAVVDAFLRIAQQADFWSTFETQSTQEAILARRPSTSADSDRADHLERVCEALADFIDIKVQETWHHSRMVAEIARDIGHVLGFPNAELDRLRYAALVHDVGKVAIPFAILTRGEQRSSSEWENYYLHSYYTQRILERVPDLRELAPAAAAHHEWVNGQGYHRQLVGEQIPLHGRILAVANKYARLLQQQGSQNISDEVLSQMHSLVGSQLDTMCYDALVRALTKKGHGRWTPIARKVGSLTARECEVLTLLVQGYNTPQIARRLGVSKKTIEHHLTHIYQKIGVTCRTAAVVYAVQHGFT